MGSPIQASRRDSRTSSSAPSSDGHPKPGVAARRRASRRSLTAMSAYETGEDAPLVHFFSSVRNIDCASAPASRTVSCSSAASRVRMASPVAFVSTSAKRQTLDAHRRRIDAVAELEIVRRLHRLEDLEQMAGYRHLAHGISEFAVLDPEAGGAATVIAGDAVDTRADQIGDVETLLDVGDQLGRRRRAGFKVQIIRPRRRRGGDAAMGVAGGGETELTRGGAIERPRRQHAFVDQRDLLHGDAFGTERLRAQAAFAQGIVDDADVLGEQLLAELVLQEAGLARDRSAIDGADDMTDQRARDARIEHHRHLAGLDLARIGAGHGALARGTADDLR